MVKHYITDPPCAFTEAVVAGYSPVDKWTCHFARIAARMRHSNWWSWLPAFPETEPERGEVRYLAHVIAPGYHPVKKYWVRSLGDALSGEISWR